MAIHGGKELWWRVNWPCDVATFVAVHPNLDWAAVLERARAQGCLRMVLLALCLARTFFHLPVPASVIAAEEANPVVSQMASRIAAAWRDGADRPPSHKVVSWELARLHDRFANRTEYVIRTLFLPGPHHVGWLALPRRLQFAYVPLKIVHDLMLLPLWRIYQGARGREQSSIHSDVS